MRRLALIGTGAAVAAVLILPAAAAWLREPEAQRLPEPVQLPSLRAPQQPDAGPRPRRKQAETASRSRAKPLNVPDDRRPRAAARARPAELEPVAAGRLSRARSPQPPSRGRPPSPPTASPPRPAASVGDSGGAGAEPAEENDDADEHRGDDLDEDDAGD
jgi:hypothetical protein